jgi:hypothetical protein
MRFDRKEQNILNKDTLDEIHVDKIDGKMG